MACADSNGLFSNNQKTLLINFRRNGMIITANISLILYATGIVTMLPIFQFFFPAPVLKLSQIQLTDEASLFFARHWGLLAFSIGALLMYAAGHPESRQAIMLFAAIEKLGVAALVAMHWRRPYAKGLRAAAAFDLSCALLYGAYLTGAV
jgi:hypothetical protein